MDAMNAVRLGAGQSPRSTRTAAAILAVMSLAAIAACSETSSPGAPNPPELAEIVESKWQNTSAVDQAVICKAWNADPTAVDGQLSALAREWKDPADGLRAKEMYQDILNREC